MPDWLRYTNTSTAFELCWKLSADFSKKLDFRESAGHELRYVDVEELTSGEKEVLRLLASGNGCMDIAFVLQTSSKTVKSHIHNICTKLEVIREAEAVRWAVRNGMARI